MHLSTLQAEPSLLQKLLVQVAPASQDTLLQLTAVSAALAAWSLAQVRHWLRCGMLLVHRGTCAGSACFTLLLCAQESACRLLCMPQGLAETPGMARNDIPGLQLALAVGATTYLLRDRKRLSLRAPSLMQTTVASPVCKYAWCFLAFDIPCLFFGACMRCWAPHFKHTINLQWKGIAALGMKKIQECVIIACIRRTGEVTTVACCCIVTRKKGHCGATARAGGLAVAGLVAGTLLGSALQSWLRVDIIPIFVRPMPRFAQANAQTCMCLLEPS